MLSLRASPLAPQGCTHCGFAIPQGREVTVTMGGKKTPVRCMLCARDLAAQSPGVATVDAPTEDPAKPLHLVSDDKGDWTSNLPNVTFLEVEGDHANCPAWSRAFTSPAAFATYIAANPQYGTAKPLTLAEWATREGQAMDHAQMPGMNMGQKGEMSMSGMDMEAMKGRLGDWSMSREGSGTSWLPDASPMFMKTLKPSGRYHFGIMGPFTLNYSDASVGGKRGDAQFYSNSMPMLMARRETGGGTLGLSLMLSLDPIFNGEYGYPNLFQTGETAHGNPLVDRQHPHDLVSELAATYSHPIGDGVRAFVYGGPVGEPALGGPMFLHRPSGMENPEAPISHHWFDSSHITWGVFTAGVNTQRWQLEGSVFNGREPDENRYAPDNIRFDSVSTRLTYNPSRFLSINTSYGYLHQPEANEPGDQHRWNGIATFSRPLPRGDNLSLTALFGVDYKAERTTDAYLLEGTYFRGRTSYFFRYENVAKDELVGVPEGDYRINKFLFGATQNFASAGGFDVGLGAYAGLYAFPSALNPYYGSSPVTLGVFLRVRPHRMPGEMAGMKGMGDMPGMGGR